MPRSWLPSRRLCTETTTRAGDTERYEGCSHRVLELPPNGARLGWGRTARALTALPAPPRLLTWPWRRQRGYMAPRLRHDIDQERARDFSQAYEDGGVVAIVLGEETGAWIQLPQDITLVDRCQLKHENRVIVAESREKPTVQEEGRQTIRPALRNVGELKQHPARFNDAHAPPPGLRSLRLTRGHTSRRLTDRAQAADQRIVRSRYQRPSVGKYSEINSL